MSTHASTAPPASGRKALRPTGPAQRRTAGTLRIARVAGIDLEAHWSWLFIVALLIWPLSAAVFPDANPGLGDDTYVAMGVAAALLLFASLALHELGHALQARREDVPIEGITLWLLGGVARFGGRFPSAGAELRIAVAGPLVSLVLGVVLLGAALALPLPAALDGVLHWLGTMNLVLLAFNMIPALPLDGGRVLRALLWSRRGDLQSATGTAVAISTAVAQAFVAGGIVLVLLTGMLGAAWFALIGWFLLNAARSEALMATGADARTAIPVGDVMVEDPVAVGLGTTLERFLDDVVSVHRHLVYPVVADGEVVGLISYRDTLRLRPDDRARRTVAELMVPRAQLLELDPGQPLVEALGALLAAPLRRALVVQDGEVVGLLSTTDALRAVELLRARVGA